MKMAQRHFWTTWSLVRLSSPGSPLHRFFAWKSRTTQCLHWQNLPYNASKTPSIRLRIKTAALAEFLAELKANPYGMVDALSEYSFAFAATSQQSVNRDMQKRKGLVGRDVNENQKGMEYEYVIVDEAARVSPCDLMVPMAQGKRIILVGDHRQLPHIIDEEVARQMEAGEAASADEPAQNETDWLKKSMFQYLFATRLKTLEDGDGISRRVTLDKQYRMHPLLGSFISRNFYERFDPTEQFGSDASKAISPTTCPHKR